ncbi:HAD family hydrolase [Bacteroides sp.]
MIQTEKVKALAFDFGGTLDSPFMHWMKVYLKLYGEELHLPLTAENFRDSYVYAEQMMERLQLVKPSHSLFETQSFKTHLQFDDLVKRGILPDTKENRDDLPEQAARLVTDFSSHYVSLSKEVLKSLSQRYTLLLVSNYYGNLKKIVTDLGIVSYFSSITDSTLEGIRKPDAALWKLAIDRAGFTPEEVVVIGDSTKNDILPALSLGCQVVKGCPSVADKSEDVYCITSLKELPDIL